MILGVGMDMTEIDRIEALLDKPTADRFLQRVLTPAERVVAQKRKARLAEYVAGRFAAKEAVAKALGTGIGAVVGFQDIEIGHDDMGKPTCLLHQDAMVRAGLDPTVRLHLTITHSNHIAAAVVVVERLHTGERSL